MEQQHKVNDFYENLKERIEKTLNQYDTDHLEYITWFVQNVDELSLKILEFISESDNIEKYRNTIQALQYLIEFKNIVAHSLQSTIRQNEVIEQSEN